MTYTLNMVAGYMREEWSETYTHGEVERSMIYPFAVQPQTAVDIERRHYFMHMFREMALHSDSRDTYIIIN